MNWVIARHLENISACLHLSVCVYVIKNGMGLSSLVEHPIMVKYVLIELFFVNNQCFISKVKCRYYSVWDTAYKRPLAANRND